MADDSDFTAPCPETDEHGARCIVPLHFLNGEEEAHEHRYPAFITRAQLDITESYGTILARIPVGNSTHEVLVMEDGAIRFAHDCDRHVRFPDRPVLMLRIAPALQFGPHYKAGTPGHQVDIRDGGRGPVVNVDPSIVCEDCGTHGFIRLGKWSDA